VIALAFAVHRKSWPLGGVSALAMIAVLVAGVFAIRGSSHLIQKIRVGDQREWVATSEDGRLQVRVPRHWKDDSEVGEDAEIHLANRVREQYLLANGFERGGDVTLKDWATAVSEEMSSNVENSTPGPLEERKIGDIPSLHTTFGGRVDGVDIVYHVTFLQLPEEFAYLLCWTLKGRERAAFPVFDKVVASFTYAPVAEVPMTPYDENAPAAERVRVLVANQLGVPLEKVTPEAEMRALGADELDVIELVMALEEEFGSEIPDDAAQKLVKVADVIQWAEAQKSAPAPAPEMESDVTDAP